MEDLEVSLPFLAAHAVLLRSLCLCLTSLLIQLSSFSPLSIHYKMATRLKLCLSPIDGMDVLPHDCPLCKKKRKKKKVEVGFVVAPAT